MIYKPGKPAGGVHIWGGMGGDPRHRVNLNPNSNGGGDEGGGTDVGNNDELESWVSHHYR